MASDPPPAYCSINTTANINVEEETSPNCDDSQLVPNYWFEDKTTRIGFMQKVVAIKFLQLLVVAAVMGIIWVCEHNRDWYMDHTYSSMYLIAISTMFYIASIIFMIHCEKLRRENPYRYLVIVLHPIFFALLISFLAIKLECLGTILVAWATHIASVFAVLLYSVFALQTALKFVAKYTNLLAAFAQIVTYACIVPFAYVNGFVVIYLALALYVDYIYIFWAINFMTTNKYWNNMKPTDFVNGAVNLHVDYYYIFTKLIVPKINDPQFFE